MEELEELWLELEELDESTELLELGVCSELLELETIELEELEYSKELELVSSDPLLEELSLASVELEELEESTELLELEDVDSETDVALESDCELLELLEDNPPSDSLELLEELISVAG